MSGLCRFLACVAFIGGCKAALAGNFLGSHGCGRYPAPSDIAGTYVHTGRNGDFIRLEIQKEGTARLDHYVFPVMGTLGGIIRMAGQYYENNWPWEEFAFEGVYVISGVSVSRRYKREYNPERDQWEILDISDPANPIKLDPATPPFPWTATFIVSALVVGGLMGRYSAKRSSIARTSIGPAL